MSPIACFSLSAIARRPCCNPSPPSFFLNRFTLSLRAPHYEIVVFTAGVAEYAAPLVDCIDPSGLVSHRLYRHHTTVPPPASFEKS